MHTESVFAHAVFLGQNQDIDTVLLSKIQEERLVGRQAMKVIFDASKTMARQGIAFRGHDEFDSNFYQIMRLITRSGSGPLNTWKRESLIGQARNLRM